MPERLEKTPGVPFQTLIDTECVLSPSQSIQYRSSQAPTFFLLLRSDSRAASHAVLLLGQA